MRTPFRRQVSGGLGKVAVCVSAVARDQDDGPGIDDDKSIKKQTLRSRSLKRVEQLQVLELADVDPGCRLPASGFRLKCASVPDPGAHAPGFSYTNSAVKYEVQR